MVQKTPLCFILVALLTGCAMTPQAGELERGEKVRRQLLEVIKSTARAGAREVRLASDALPEWKATHVTLTPELFAKGPGETDAAGFKYSGPYIHTRIVDWQCRYMMIVPVLLWRDPPTRAVKTEDFFGFGDGDCYELSQGRYVAYLSLYSLSVDLDKIIPKELRQKKILREALYIAELDHYKGYYNVRTDEYAWDAAGFTVGEVAGSHTESFSLVHIPVYEIRRSNFYRVLLMGKHTIALLVMIGPTSASLDDLRLEALPILKALRYTEEGG